VHGTCDSHYCADKSEGFLTSLIPFTTRAINRDFLLSIPTEDEDIPKQDDSDVRLSELSLSESVERIESTYDVEGADLSLADPIAQKVPSPVMSGG
jgi:hypothetical protein